MGSNLGQGGRLSRPLPEFVRHVEALFPSLEQKLEAAEAVQALTSSHGWSVLLAVLDAEAATVDRELDSHREPLSRAKYAAAHGRRGGLRSPSEALFAITACAERDLERQRSKHEGDAESSPEGG